MLSNSCGHIFERGGRYGADAPIAGIRFSGELSNIGPMADRRLLERPTRKRTCETRPPNSRIDPIVDTLASIRNIN